MRKQYAWGQLCCMHTCWLWSCEHLMSLVLLREKSACSHTPKGLCTWVSVTSVNHRHHTHRHQHPNYYQELTSNAMYTNIWHPDGESWVKGKFWESWMSCQNHVWASRKACDSLPNWLLIILNWPPNQVRGHLDIGISGVWCLVSGVQHLEFSTCHTSMLRLQQDVWLDILRTAGSGGLTSPSS